MRRGPTPQQLVKSPFKPMLLDIDLTSFHSEPRESHSASCRGELGRSKENGWLVSDQERVRKIEPCFQKCGKAMLGCTYTLTSMRVQPNCKSSTYMIVAPIITILTKGYGNGHSEVKALRAAADLNVMNPMPSVSLRWQNLPSSPIALVGEYPWAVHHPQGMYGVMENNLERETGARTVFFPFFEAGCETEALTTEISRFCDRGSPRR